MCKHLDFITNHPVLIPRFSPSCIFVVSTVAKLYKKLFQSYFFYSLYIIIQFVFYTPGSMIKEAKNTQNQGLLHDSVSKKPNGKLGRKEIISSVYLFLEIRTD